MKTMKWALTFISVYLLAISQPAHSQTIQVNPTSLEFGIVAIGESATLTYTLTGSGLTDNVTILSPPGFQASITNNQGFTNNLTVIQENGMVNRQIFVRYTPTSETNPTANIINSSLGATNVVVQVSGTGVFMPVIELQPAVLNYGAVYTGECSAPATFTLTNTGAGIAEGTFKISGAHSSEFLITMGESPFSLPAGESTEIQINFCPIINGDKIANLEAEGTGFTNTAVSNLSGSGVAAGSPLISVVPDALSFGEVIINTSSAPQSYTVSGFNLDAPINISLESDLFRISLEQNTGYANSILINPVNGTIHPTQVFVRFRPTQTGEINSTISNTSAGASTRNVAVSGTGKLPETVFFSITTAVLPMNSGMVTGAGSYAENTSVTLTATPSMGYHFYKWSENQQDIFTGPVFSFPATRHRHLTAHFVDENYILLSSYLITTPLASGFQIVTVNADQNWTATPDDDWISVYPNYGSSGTLEVMVSWLGAGNITEREATINFEGTTTESRLMIKQSITTSVVDQQQNTLKVYPNPARDQIYVSNITSECTIFLYDLSGRLMKQQNANQNGPISIDVSDLSAGIYTLRIAGKHHQQVTKIIIQ